jgi:predicted transcriptional regulator
MDSAVLELIFLSKKRTDILLFLKEGPKTIAEINEYLNLSSVAVLPQLKKLRDNSLILKKKNVYSLSPLGIATVGRAQPMIDLLNVFGTQYDYWTSHAVECIPAPFLKRIGDLSNCTFSEPPDKTCLFEPHKEFIENLKKSNEISGIASIFHPSYPSFFLGLTKMGIDVSIIVTSQVFERLREEFKDILREFLKFENGNLYVCSQKIEFSYVVTDRFISLSLPFSDGTYDHQRDILCFDSAAIQWGEDLFAHYRDISEKITEI